MSDDSTDDQLRQLAAGMVASNPSAAERLAAALFSQAEQSREAMRLPGGVGCVLRWNGQAVEFLREVER